MDWPTELQINAYTGDGKKAASGRLPPKSKRWPLRNAPPPVRTFLKAPAIVDLSQWNNEEVGWGVVAAETPGITDEQKQTSSDLPEPIQQLIKDRGNAPVFRYRPGWEENFRLLRCYARGIDVAIGQSPDGLKRESIPRYLLIVGGPEEIPWQFQYVLNGHYATGRLHLKGDALENYVTALRNGWTDAGADPKKVVVWSVNQGSADITGLMHEAIAYPVYQDLSADSDFAAGTKFLDGAGAATSAQLRAALGQYRPGLIVTTSHGQTYPLDNMDLLATGLGLPVDQDYNSVQISDLLSEWQPGGTIWYSHACCSAGSSGDTLFDGLFDAGSELDRVLKGVAKLGSRVAPLPTALLGAKKPARAFVGHVEPTFDWTLRNPDTRQMLTDALRKSLYRELYQPHPIGQAFRRCYDLLGSLYTMYDADLAEFGRGGSKREAMLKDLLCARDLQSMVILGDPTAALPL